MFLGGTTTTIEMLSTMGVSVLEVIVANELCEFDGRKNWAHTNVRITPLVRTRSVDVIPKSRFLCCNV